MSPVNESMSPVDESSPMGPIQSSPMSPMSSSITVFPSSCYIYNKSELVSRLSETSMAKVTSLTMNTTCGLTPVFYVVAKSLFRRTQKGSMQKLPKRRFRRVSSGNLSGVTGVNLLWNVSDNVQVDHAFKYS